MAMEERGSMGPAAAAATFAARTISTGHHSTMLQRCREWAQCIEAAGCAKG